MKLYLLLLLFCQQGVFGEYLITTPQKWAAGYDAQICVSVPEELCGPDDHLTLTLYSLASSPRRPSFWRWRRRRTTTTTPVPKKILLQDMKINTPEYGKVCTTIKVPNAQTRYGEIKLTGYLGGSEVNESRYITFALKVYETFISTDKYMYKAGQKVKFRVLTLEGPFFKVSTKPYKSIYVETPSGARIAQWLNVPNTAGLIHKELQLIDEPEEGTYIISVKQSDSTAVVRKAFRIQDFVLPRFEVKITPPKYVLATDKSATFKICATYTFGQPVRGKLTGTIDNGQWRNRKVSIPINQSLFGCTDIKVSLKDLKVNSKRSFSYRINIKVKFEEDGTGTTIDAKSSVSITRRVLNLRSINYAPYKKAELPWINVVKATFPDGTPATHEEFSACAGKECFYVYSDEKGLVKFSVPPYLHNERRVVLKSVSYPRLYLPGSNTSRAPTYSSVTKRRRRRRRPRPYMYESQLYVYGSNYYSPTNSSLLILPPESGKINCNPGGAVTLDLPILYSANDTTEAMLNIQVVSRGQIQHSEEVHVDFVSTDLDEFNLELIESWSHFEHDYFKEGMVTGATHVTLSIPPIMSPKIEIIVWYVRHDGEVVPDNREIGISKCLPHQVTMSWPVDRAEQGTTETLYVSAEPKALCSVGVVDKSVEILSKGQERLTLNNIFRILNRVRPNPWEARQINNFEYCRKKFPTASKSSSRSRSSRRRPYYPSGYGVNAVDAIKMFDDAGLFVITDMTVETRLCRPYGRQNYRAMPTARPVQAPGPPPRRGLPGRPRRFSASETTAQDSVRSYFPETWLWQLAVIPEDGHYEKDFKLPDTITEWVGKAVCVHPTKGIGLSAPTSITTFTPFFVDLTLLPSIRQGEIMPVVISVFNYLKSTLPVKLELSPTPEFDILEGNSTVAANDQTAAGSTALCISSGDKKTFSISIRPQKAGDIKFVVVASVDQTNIECNPDAADLSQRSDTIIKSMAVEYEGFPRDQTITKYVCSEDLDPESQNVAASWTLQAPDKDIVPDSTRAWIAVVGDLLGPTLENLGHLIRMPSGCGEQNLLGFAPNIYVLQYLEASEQVNKVTEDKLLRFMNSGYQRQLNYKHQRGGYSAFGPRDDSGSTWLTAFVVKTFAQSRPYISVDDKELNISSDWLKATQNPESGCFENKGRVIHKAMKGGVSDSKPALLTAYVMAALLEAGESSNSDAITKAITCLRGKDPESTGMDIYEMAIKAYAFSLAKTSDTPEVISDLLKLAKTTHGGTYWDVPDTSGKTYGEKIKSSPVAVETAAYVVLAMLNSDADDYMDTATLVVRWISTQRNSQGGFISTQDTVLALQALALYESYQSRAGTDLTVSAQASAITETFQITESNKLLTQRYDIPEVPAEVTFKMEGTGCALLQGVVRYNVLDARPSEALNVSVSTHQSSSRCKAKKIEVCGTYLLRDGKSNMAIFETKIVSGFIPDKESLKRAISTGRGIVQRYEVDGNTVLFYLNELTPKPTCVEFEVLSEVNVWNTKPGTVKVYDYYEPDFQVSATYKMPFSYCSKLSPVQPLLVEADIITDSPATEAPTVDTSTKSDIAELVDALEEIPLP